MCPPSPAPQVPETTSSLGASAVMVKLVPYTITLLVEKEAIEMGGGWIQAHAITRITGGRSCCYRRTSQDEKRYCES